MLATGAGLGIVLAAAGLLGASDRGRGVPADAVARVNGEPIGRATFARVLAGVAGDRREPLDAAERRRILDRLIDEELLVQRGVALGLMRRDARVRKDVTAAVIDAVSEGSVGAEPTTADLERLYAARPELSSRPTRLRVRRVWCRTSKPEDEERAAARAADASRRLGAGEPFEAVRALLGDDEVVPLPDALLPAAKLLDYLGPTALRAAMELAPGATSAPVRANGGYEVLQVVERGATERATLDEVRETLIGELRRERGEQALRGYLDDLRRDAQIELAEPLP